MKSESVGREVAIPSFLPSFLSILSAVLIALVVTAPALADPMDVDLDAAGLQFTQTGSDYTVTAQVGLSALGTGTFNYTVKLEQYRNGFLVDTLLDETLSGQEDSVDSCSVLCNEDDCGKSCKMQSPIGVAVLFGTCGYRTDCSPGTKHCRCAVFNHMGVLDVIILPGDVFKLTVGPGSGTTDVDSSNDDYQVTF